MVNNTKHTTVPEPPERVVWLGPLFFLVRSRCVPAKGHQVFMRSCLPPIPFPHKSLPKGTLWFQRCWRYWRRRGLGKNNFLGTPKDADESLAEGFLEGSWRVSYNGLIRSEKSSWKRGFEKVLKVLKRPFRQCYPYRTCTEQKKNLLGGLKSPLQGNADMFWEIQDFPFKIRGMLPGGQPREPLTNHSGYPDLSLADGTSQNC